MGRSGSGFGLMALLALSAVLLLASRVEAGAPAAYTVHHAHRAIYARDTQIVRHQSVFEVTRKDNEPFKAVLMPGNVVLAKAYGSSSEDPNKDDVKKVPFYLDNSRIEEYRGVECVHPLSRCTRLAVGSFSGCLDRTRLPCSAMGRHAVSFGGGAAG